VTVVPIALTEVCTMRFTNCFVVIDAALYICVAQKEIKNEKHKKGERLEAAQQVEESSMVLSTYTNYQQKMILTNRCFFLIDTQLTCLLCFPSLLIMQKCNVQKQQNKQWNSGRARMDLWAQPLRLSLSHVWSCLVVQGVF